ncbi:DUF4189 domain-containing protein [Lysobacter yananisis]|uniref:DUF4189 domain-containing protein n=1 Tax=Lysobacter yananisis TaxID=1003114 RepID=A0ABY9P685_9GAMM|nr:DUF4189 domain-containing protein [Lysobacter yananisis]WMT02572.1 DUF4189 domain-containing protein [Lysobacter yananisis]
MNGNEPNARKATVFLFAFIASLPAHAFACTMVYGNGWQGCVETPEREPVQFDRWGAVATDKSNGAFGAADTVSERARAIKKAIKKCKDNKGVHCEIRLIYRNECAAAVSGSGWDFFNSDPDRETAISTAVRRCEEKDTDCKVVYTRCSYAVSR